MPGKPVRTVEKPLRAALVGALVGALATLPGLGVGTLWDNSETAYGEVAREILLRHDWIVMHLNGQPWFIQPPLYFWIAAAMAHVLGVTAFALRLPSALATIGMSAALAYALAREAGERTGILAGVVLSTALMQIVLGRMAIMDAALDLAVTVAILAWYRALATGSTPLYLCGAVATGLGFLAKGPVALAIALLVIVPYSYWSRREVHLPSARACVGGALLFIGVVAPWLVALGARAGTSHVAELIGHYTFGRYTGVIENQSGPVWYYVPVLVIAFFPWVAFLPPAVACGVNRARREPLWRLGMVWIVAPLLFFSFAQTKLPNYIALELPGLALVTALYFDVVARKGATKSALVAAAAVPVTIGMIAIAIRVFSLANRLTGDLWATVTPLLCAATAIFVGSLLTFALLARRTTRAQAPFALGLAMLAAADVLAVAVLPKAEAFKPIPAFAAAIDRERRPGDLVAIVDVSGSNALVFYTRPGVVVLSSAMGGVQNENAVWHRVVCNAPRVWLVAPRERGPLEPTYGRRLQRVATAAKAELWLYGGATCSPVRR